MSATGFRNIVIFTASFPYGGPTEASFVGPELGFWTRKCERVVIVPLQRLDGPMAKLPSGVEVADDLIGVTYGRCERLRYAFSQAVWRSLAEGSGSGRKKAATFTAQSLAYRDALSGMFARLGIDVGSTLFYSFWFDASAAAMALLSLRPEYSGLSFISRVHGYEVRPVRSPWLYRLTLSRIKGCYPASSMQARPLCELFDGQSAPPVYVSHLGSPSPEVEPKLGPRPDPLTVRFLSVARLVGLKRVGLVAKLVAAVARKMPGYRIEWTHIGDGPEMSDLSEMLSQNMPSNLLVELAGARPNGEVHRFYAERYVDWSVLLSTVEACPIVLCESASHGVPMIATRVGGIPEIADDKVGILADPDPDISRLAAQVAETTLDSGRCLAMRREAYSRWLTDFDSAKLREEFVEHVMKGEWKW